ncbi:MAG: PilZ domain-containing protein [Archangiaceae bacterium]|nr:PilZ domain-containing protein [Archangiaceae bacterium]
MRLKVSYKTPEALLSEFTRSVGRGGVTIESKKSLPVGTRFVFELRAQGVPDTVEIFGEVLRVTTTDRSRHLLDIRYDAPAERKGLDVLIQRIFDAHAYEKIRKHPRIPLRLRATDTSLGDALQYVVRDISRGGLGIELELPAIPKTIKTGTPFLLTLTLSIGPVALHGEVVWLFQPPRERRVLNPALGVQFGKLRPETIERLERILKLRGLPAPPWRAQVSFGLDAVERMP